MHCSTVRVKVSCPDEACAAKATGTVRVPKIGNRKLKTYKLTSASSLIGKGAAAMLKPKLSDAARKAIRRALQRGRRITVKLTITARDAAGNTKTFKRNIRLES